MAPELLAHADVDTPPPFSYGSDMWALALVVVEVSLFICSFSYAMQSCMVIRYTLDVVHMVEHLII
jgi:hypothetical protein